MKGATSIPKRTSAISFCLLFLNLCTLNVPSQASLPDISLFPLYFSVLLIVIALQYTTSMWTTAGPPNIRWESQKADGHPDKPLSKNIHIMPMPVAKFMSRTRGLCGY